MNRSIFAASERVLANTTRSSAQLLANTFRTLALQHPALAHPAEEDSIQLSLDLSFQRAIAVSSVDRQIIDKLCRPLPLSTALSF